MLILYSISALLSFTIVCAHCTCVLASVIQCRDTLVIPLLKIIRYFHQQSSASAYGETAKQCMMQILYLEVLFYCICTISVHLCNLVST